MTNLGKGAWLHNNSAKGTVAVHVKLTLHLTLNKKAKKNMRKEKKNLRNLQRFPKQLQPLGRLHKNGDLPYDFVICNFLSFAQK